MTLEESTPKLCEDIPSMFRAEAARKALEDAQGGVVWSRADGRMPSTFDRCRGTSDRRALDNERQPCSRTFLHRRGSDPEAVARDSRRGNGWR